MENSKKMLEDSAFAGCNQDDALVVMKRKTAVRQLSEWGWKLEEKINLLTRSNLLKFKMLTWKVTTNLVINKKVQDISNNSFIYLYMEL